MDFAPIYPGFEISVIAFFFFVLCFFFFFFFFGGGGGRSCHYYYCAKSTLLSLPRFSYFITPYYAQSSSAFRALIDIGHCTVIHCDAEDVSLVDQ